MQSLVIFASFAGILSGVLSQDFCDNRFTRIGESAYHLETRKVNWWDSARRCAALGGRLATIDSEAELNAITTFLNQAGFTATDAVWTSGFGIKTGAWVSLGGAKILTYFRWASGEPNDSGNENCLALKGPGTWQMNDLSCYKEFAYLCEASPKSD
ncbi:hypothetical protein KR018_000853 [Drosophila ironensis]|nr:hypothetical protein KR018_000853 [Drosophila ironensis]